MNNEKTIVGGTFDHFHKGHKALLEKAFETGNVSIGLTSDKMAEERKNRKVQSYKERENILRDFAKSNDCEVDIRKIEDSFGFGLEKDFKNIVVSKETRSTALEMNKEREKTGKEVLNIIEVELIPAEDGKPISSTRIFNGEIDQEGNII